MDRASQYSRRMTVANIREREGEDFVEVIFLESARFYRLLRNGGQFTETLEVLRRALERNEPLTVTFESPGSDIIDVATPTRNSITE